MSWLGDILDFVGGTIRGIFVFIGILLLLVGVVFSLSVIGLVIGIPLIVAGIVIILMGSLFFPKRRRVKVVYRVKDDPNVIDVKAKK